MTSIEWTDCTWNPTRGCSVVSAGCHNCYAMKFAHRYSGQGRAYEGMTKQTRSGPQWTGVVRLVPEMLDKPLRWRKPRRIFVNSMSDLFHEALPDEAIAAVFGAMACSPQHTFQVLTKRPERMRAFLTRADLSAEYCMAVAVDRMAAVGCPPMRRGEDTADHVDRAWQRRTSGPVSWTLPLPNVWLGVSVEDQRAADERIPLLLQTPAAVRFLSVEPLLGPLDLRGRSSRNRDACIRCGNPPGFGLHDHPDGYRPRGIDWVIVGGESGPGARPCDVGWIRSIVAQCQAAGVPCFVKQLGAQPRARGATTQGGPPGEWKLRDRKGGDMSEWPEDLRVREFPRETLGVARG